MAEQIITFDKAIAKFNIYKKIPIPSSKRCMTKADINTYLNTDPISYSTYSNNQLVPESGFINPKLAIGSGFNGMVRGITSYDSNLYIGGEFTSYNTVNASRIAKINYSGVIDTSFSTGSGFNGTVEGCLVTASNKLIVFGWFSSYRGTPMNYIARLNLDGSLDTTFNIGSGFNGIVRMGTELDDGSLMLVGDFTAFNGTPCNYICKLNSNGSINTQFINNIGVGFNSQVAHINKYSSNQVIIGGYFKVFNSTTSWGLIILYTDGSISSSYGNWLKGANNVQAVQASYVMNDGTIMIGGSFSSFNNVNRKNLAVISGSSVTNFNSNAGPNNQVASIQKTSNDKFLISGDFTSVNGVGYNKLAFLNLDGSIDTNFGVNGFNSFARTSELQSDGKILIGGAFTSYSGVTMNRLLRLNVDYSLDTI